MDERHHRATVDFSRSRSEFGFEPVRWAKRERREQPPATKASGLVDNPWRWADAAFFAQVLAHADEIGLSKPYQEVAALAAAGLSNAQIADQLHVPESTVWGRLHTIYQKAGPFVDGV